MLGAKDKAPEFHIEGDDGKIHSLALHKGEFVVLYFYPKDNTPGCTVEACDFRDNMDSFKDLGAVVYGVSKDSLKSHEGFKKKEKLNFVLLSDPDMKLHKAYGAVKEEDPTKTQRSTFLIGPDGKIAFVWPTVSVKGHVEDVKEKIDNLKLTT